MRVIAHHIVALLPLALAGLCVTPAAAAETSAPAGSAPAPAEPPPRVKVLVMDITAAGLDAATVENISGLVAVMLAEDDRLDVLSGADFKQLAALEGEKQSLGCTSDASCLAEVAGAMGAGLIVYGNGGHFGQVLNLNLNLFDATKARSVGRAAVQARSLDELPEKLRPALEQMVAGAMGPRPTKAVASSPGALPWVMAGGGALLAVAGVAGVVVGVLPAMQIADAEARFDDGDEAALADAAAVQQDWYDNNLAPGLLAGGIAAGLVGVAVAGAGTAWAMGGGE